MAASGFLFGASSGALASPGCTALNGSLNAGTTTGGVSGTGFSAGDTITLTVTAAFGVDELGLANETSATVLLAPTSATGSRTYVVAAATNDRFGLAGSRASMSSVFSWTCVPGAGNGTSATDSEKLGSVQSQGSNVVANTSTAAVSGSVNAAIDEALDQPGSAAPAGRPERGPLFAAIGRSISIDAALALLPPGAGSGYLTRDAFIVYFARLHGYETLSAILYDHMSREFDRFTARGQGAVWTGTEVRVMSMSGVSPFSAERRSTVSERADEAFAALGYAAVNKAPSQRATLPVTQWTPWVDVRGSGFDQSGSTSMTGSQINATAGLNYRLRHNVVLGVFAGYENFNYEFASLSGRLKGDGGTIGVNAGWAITPTLRWKGMIGWTGVGYDATAASAAGSFSGSRWMVSTGLTGYYRVSTLTAEPSVDVIALNERQTDYTDSLGVAHASRSFTSGRVAVGGRVLAQMMQFTHGFTPYAGLYGDWRFASNSAQPAAVSDAGIGHGWSARVTAGLSTKVWSRGTLSVGGELGGLGANYKTWTGNARLSMPF